MQQVTPKLFGPIAQTAIVHPAPLHRYLDEVGAPEWTTSHCDDAEKLIEVCGRACYRSFKPDLNPNVTRVREGNDTYLANILQSGHGSVLEHASATFVFHNVSRVFTHELVRHRVGTAMSQESLRYVRLTDLNIWFPSCISDKMAENPGFAGAVVNVVETLEEMQKSMAELYKLDDDGVPFAYKKEITSAMRRLAPIGLATSITWTANFRTLRHVIQMRTSVHAEEEMRIMFTELAERCKLLWPNVFQDMSVNDAGEYVFEHGAR